ncbi:hypothetical protein [Crocosphaera watsonii]|uniref:Uncharacterized protein n=1 Tax=Crocosphaera watsonii WH 0401 TaxID=555881 RepID=T2J2V7_CROWT|nr:hypothetical protein [Crocosphaera watsonii]CCQ60203.1 hypothetical protein CWATWH0401_2099 [Crocosphaera watsonii WH 0401]
MQGLLKRFWQWIQQFFAQVFGSSSPLGRDDKNASQQPLSDTEYEFLLANSWMESPTDGTRGAFSNILKIWEKEAKPNSG